MDRNRLGRARPGLEHFGPEAARFLPNELLHAEHMRRSTVAWRPSPRRSAQIDRILVVLALFSVTTTTFALVSELGWPRPGDALQGVASPVSQPAPPHIAEAGRLARHTLLTLHDANRTGNYAVLRALAAPGFQAANSADDLARIFATQRAQGLDLSTITSQQPRWIAPPGPDALGLLRLSGAYPLGDTLEARFELAYEAVAGDWRLIEIAVTPHAR